MAPDSDDEVDDTDDRASGNVDPASGGDPASDSTPDIESPDTDPVDLADDVESPIEGQILLLAAAKASVAGERVPALARRVQAHLGPQAGDYRERYERAFVDDDAEYFLVPPDHWTDVGDNLGLGERAVDAVRRAHEQQLRRVARRRDRAEEMDAALEVRTAVVVGTAA